MCNLLRITYIIGTEPIRVKIYINDISIEQLSLFKYLACKLTYSYGRSIDHKLIAFTRVCAIIRRKLEQKRATEMQQWFLKHDVTDPVILVCSVCLFVLFKTLERSWNYSQYELRLRNTEKMIQTSVTSRVCKLNARYGPPMQFKRWEICRTIQKEIDRRIRTGRWPKPLSRRQRRRRLLNFHAFHRVKIFPD